MTFSSTSLISTQMMIDLSRLAPRTSTVDEGAWQQPTARGLNPPHRPIAPSLHRLLCANHNGVLS